MSTDFHSNGSQHNTGQMVNIMSNEEEKESLDSPNIKHMHHKFDETLHQTIGDVSLVMRISTNQVLASKILEML